MLITADHNRAFTAAENFNTLAPWKFMPGYNVFGVLCQGGEPRWCVVMGQERSVFGLAMYRGQAGWDYLDAARDMRIDEFDTGVDTPGCSLWFSDRSEMRPDSVALVKEIGRKYRGKAAWPEFTDMQPGKVAQVPDSSEFSIIATVLEQALVHLQLAEKESIDFKFGQVAKKTVARCQEADGTWHTAWIPTPSVTAEQTPSIHLNELEMVRLRQARRHVDPGWIVDWFYTFAVIDDESVDQRPYIPVFGIVMDIKTGMILAQDCCHPDKRHQGVADMLMKTMANHGVPKHLLVRRPIAVRMLAPMAAFLGIDIQQNDKLTPHIAEVRNMLNRSMANDHG